MARRPVDRILLLLFVVYFTCLGSIWALYKVGTPTSVKVTVYDQIARPGEEVELAAKFERDGQGPFNPDLEDVEVAVKLGAANAKEMAGPTDKEGMLRVRVKAPGEAGSYSIRATLKDSKYRARGSTQPGRLSVLDPDRPILICDIDDTITAGGGYKLFVPGKEPSPRPGAAAELAQLARRYNLIFLTARDDSLLEVTRAWLQAHGFPPAPVVGRDWTWKNFADAGGTKLESLRAWRRRFGDIAWGIGNSKGDHEAYTGARIRHIMIGDEVPPEKRTASKVESFQAADWTRVGAIIREHEAAKKEEGTKKP